ncbi:alpha-1,3-mannosyl-glycoprotein 2-beta-N-acetylglucosaminyltransferase-like isoform X2 [Lineus longissimus]|uniref:alpha-1,3-mannosyl-glycoprotein 2-beta-N-acetylglucosaminyltransferase-like isoform X2 n=1 Tax=Lineus longissimus TaxID=88925 RepID=UPI002B4D896B
MKRRFVIVLLSIIFSIWTYLNYYLISSHTQQDQANLVERLGGLQSQLENQVKFNEKLLGSFKKYKEALVQKHAQSSQNEDTKKPVREVGQTLKASTISDPAQGKVTEGAPPPASTVYRPAVIDINKAVIAVLVFACNRVTVKRNLDQLIKYRPSPERFPIVVSQDCGHGETAAVIQSYGHQLTHIQHPDLSNIQLPYNQRKFMGYYKIARHYKWALNQVFHSLNHSTVIIVEDDLDISPDFFEYFGATFPILHYDSTLWCVSAWNDNGKANMVSDEAELLYRTDFFPGLGWMVEKRLWLELEKKWPKTFWDDWMRHPDQRQERACIRPEISRTSTFGKIGVSKGQYFEKHLKFIKLNTRHVPFTKLDLSFLKKENFDELFAKKVYSSPLLSLTQVILNQIPSGSVSIRLEYTTKAEFKNMAKKLGIMDDLKSGVPRMGYRGVVSFMRNGKRIYLSPPANWKGYDRSWT